MNDLQRFFKSPGNNRGPAGMSSKDRSKPRFAVLPKRPSRKKRDGQHAAKVEPAAA